MTEKDADLSALMAVRLGSGEDRHRGLLFGGRDVREAFPYGDTRGFTVRDRTDTDQGRHRPGGGRERERGPVTG
ncbi:hypothetical protein GCM10014713_14510 [Streptomyces purpureus]|uniref:Uncharacterized protein n=1 Tax=Streptomyces purpureus TaxID=1951 RepID=A0A918GZN1_9ACTN|nr:hypothetical protein GCM10014713_14510 [Streptomyces purpureus]